MYAKWLKPEAVSDLQISDFLEREASMGEPLKTDTRWVNFHPLMNGKTI